VILVGHLKEQLSILTRENYFANRIIIVTNVIDFEERRSNTALIRTGISIRYFACCVGSKISTKSPESFLYYLRQSSRCG
jgi:hypothetical protein